MVPQEVDRWLRERCIENILTSASTLHSLGNLLDKISNIVINDDIAAQVLIVTDINLSQYHKLFGGWFGVVVMSLVTSTKLSYVESGQYRLAGLPSSYLSRPTQPGHPSVATCN